MSTQLILTLIAILISVAAFTWRVYEFQSDRQGRFKITYQFYPNFILSARLFTAIYEFTIVNTGGKKRIIKNVCHQYDTLQDDGYSPLLQHLKFPISLEPGESIQYVVDYADFDSLLEKSGARKIRIIVTDSFSKEYKSRWTKVQKWDIPTRLKEKGYEKATSNHPFEKNTNK